MRKLMAIAIGVGALLVVMAVPANPAQAGMQRAWVLGPPGCVKVRFMRSRQTRYAGAPRCRRIYS
jgi:hypothetical protein